MSQLLAPTSLLGMMGGRRGSRQHESAPGPHEPPGHDGRRGGEAGSMSQLLAPTSLLGMMGPGHDGRGRGKGEQAPNRRADGRADGGADRQASRPPIWEISN